MAAPVWDGNYDEHGREVARPRFALAFRTAETVNESAAERGRAMVFDTPA